MNRNKQTLPDRPAPARPHQSLRIALVGPCSSGKSMLADFLKPLGYAVRQPTQEHSGVPNMWQRISKPDLLIFLDVDYENTRRRRPHHDRGEDGLAAQQRKLAHARANCDFYIDTSGLTPVEIQNQVLAFLGENNMLL